MIGTHNSYHLRGHDSLLALIAQVKPSARRELDYGHRPLPEQLAQLGIRQIELDCYADPDGGRYAQPLGRERVVQAGLPPVPEPDPAGRLRQPGIKVMHVPDIDYASSALTLVDALRQVREWSVKHPRHVPVFIMLELKEESLGPGFTQPAPFDQAQLANLEKEILSVFPRESILTPDDVRGRAATLPEALRQTGWPLLDSVRGRVMFGMDNEGAVRDRYLEGHPALEGRLVFVSVPATNPAAAWMKRNDPVADFDANPGAGAKWVSWCGRGRMRTPPRPARTIPGNATGRWRAGRNLSAPTIRSRTSVFRPIRVRLPGGVIARSNPVNGPASDRGRELE